MNADFPRIGIIGAGFGAYCHLPALRRIGQTNIAGIWSRTLERTRHVSDQFGVSPLYGNPVELIAEADWDMAIVAVPTPLQEKIAMTCLDRGIPVFAAKPLSTSATTAFALRNRSAERGVKTGIDFIFPEIATIRRALELVRGGHLGKLRHVNIRWLFESYDVRSGKLGWKTRPDEGGGVVSYFGSHMLHLMELFAGQAVEMKSTVAPIPDVPDGTEGFVNLETKHNSGVTASLMINMTAHGVHSHRIELEGDLKTICLHNETGNPVAFDLVSDSQGDIQSVDGLSSHMAPSDEDPRVEPLSKLLRRFISGPNTDVGFSPSFEEGSRVQNLIDCIRHTDTTGWQVIPGLEQTVPAHSC